jgi:phage shock protein E
MKTFVGLFLFCCIAILFVPVPVLGQEKETPAARKPSSTPKNVTVDEAEKLLMKNKEVIVLDVRTPKEFAQGHLSGATNLNLYAPDFDQKLSALDKNKSYLVHCAMGGRSAEAVEKMKGLKFNSIYHMDEGFKGWENAGKKTVK